MYLALVLTIMLLAPLASIAGHAAWTDWGGWPARVATWFVFWGVGVRLLPLPASSTSVTASEPRTRP